MIGLVLAAPASAEAIRTVILPDSELSISAVRVERKGKDLIVRARVGWIIPVTSHKLDYLHVAAFGAGQCWHSVVKPWNRVRHHGRLPRMTFHVNLRVDSHDIDEVRLSRIGNTRPEGCS